MAPKQAFPRVPTPFSERGFYLSEFRGRTLALAVRASDLQAPAPVESVLKELEANPTRVVVISTDPEALAALPASEVLAGDPREPGLEGAVWRALARGPRVGLAVAAGDTFAPVCRHIAVRLGLVKMIWLDREGGLQSPRGGRASFVDLTELRSLLTAGNVGPERASLLQEVEAALAGGVESVNLCTPEGLADEIFSYAGSGTLFTRERYVQVRRLRLDDYDAADDLIARGIAEGYLAPRSPEQIDLVLANGFGAFVEGRYLAGIGALLSHDAAQVAEIASLYTLTRFLGEGVGEHLVTAAVKRAREDGFRSVFACTTSDRVVGFFERQGFALVSPDQIPEEKWRSYDPARRPLVRCVQFDL